MYMDAALQQCPDVRFALDLGTGDRTVITAVEYVSGKYRAQQVVQELGVAVEMEVWVESTAMPARRTMAYKPYKYMITSVTEVQAQNPSQEQPTAETKGTEGLLTAQRARRINIRRAK